MIDKADGGKRPCGDYTRLNAQTIPDGYPLPLLQDFSANLAGCQVFSKVDLIRGYHQIPVAPADIHKTAVVTPFGLFEYTRMPFSLCNAAQTFQRLMDEVCETLPFVFAYLDDILVASTGPEQHREHVRALFTCLHEYRLAINPAKCVIGKAMVEFLGHRVSAAGITPLPAKVAAVKNYPPPRTVREHKGCL